MFFLIINPQICFSANSIQERLNHCRTLKDSKGAKLTHMVFRSRCLWNLWSANWIKCLSHLRWERRKTLCHVESLENIIADSKVSLQWKTGETPKRKVHRIGIDKFLLSVYLCSVWVVRGAFAQLLYVNLNILIFIAIALSKLLLARLLKRHKASSTCFNASLYI